ncbi:MAG: msmE 3, partial [Microbacterium sp.]|nr:msmE 3 [Microbacterium sp.]
PIFVSGSWWYGRFVDEIDGFDWGLFPFPDSQLSLGSSGNLWVVPERSGSKDLAYEFIDITMRPEIQALIGNNGGLPVAADEADITDPKSLELIQAFNAVNEQDGLSFYPDWPTPTFYDTLVAELQELVNGTKTPAEVQQALGDEYESYAADFR